MLDSGLKSRLQTGPAMNLTAKRLTIGALAPFHFSFMGGLRDHAKIENELTPALAKDLRQAQVDLALLVPY